MAKPAKKTLKKADNNQTHKAAKVVRLKHMLRIAADSPLPEIAFIASLILSRWLNNSDFSYPFEIVVPILLFGFVCTIFYYAYRSLFKVGTATHLAAISLSYLSYNFEYTNGLGLSHFLLHAVPHGSQTALNSSLYLLAVYGVIIGLAAWAVQTVIIRSKNIRSLQPYKVVMFAVAFVFLFQLGKSLLRLLEIRNELVYHYPSLKINPDTSKVVGSRPDIYFLMPEDYADQQTLKSVNSYDNSSFLNYLSNQGFANQQPASYSSYPFTMSSLASDLAMSYFPEFHQKFGGNGKWQTGFPYRSVINNPPIAQVLKRSGYQYNQVSSWWDFTRTYVKADSDPTKGYRLRVIGQSFYQGDLSRDIFNKSVLSPWLKKGISFGRWPLLKYDLDYNPRENLDTQISAIKTIANRSSRSKPQFTFGHFMIPHTPYIFKSDGSDASYDSEHNDIGAPETTKYANQVAFFNSQMEDMISYIRQHSPGAIIIIQSDEGSYPPEFRYEQTPHHYYDPFNLPQQQMRQKFSILSSYYMPAQDKGVVLRDINSPVNAFRFVLNNYLGYSVTYLPSCNFTTGNKFGVYNYHLVTDKLTGRDQSACQPYL